MKLSEYVDGIEVKLISGSLDTDVTEPIYDSRKVSNNCVFICIVGTARDSHNYIPEVIKQGASAIIIEADHEEKVKELLGDNTSVTVISTTNTRKALAYCSSAYFGRPASKLTTIGITGTKGKTTTSYMVQSILEKAGRKVGVIGTIGCVIAGEHYHTANTTPESYELQRLMSIMVEKGCDTCVMEVSSQGLKMDRVAGFTFDIGVFTNFSADHIGPGEHASMEEYLYCKSLLFQRCRLGLINIDDPSAEGAIKNHTCEIKTFGFKEKADLRAFSFDLTRDGGQLGIRFDTKGLINENDISLKLPGKFNVYNALCALMVGHFCHIRNLDMLKALSDIQVKGRAEIVPLNKPYTVLIDYAHNEVSVESLLTTLHAYEPNRIICVYGGGGNRSKLRRYAMGELCGKMADLSILTMDNPRDEDIASINADIQIGLSKSNGKFEEVPDRKEAIWHAMDIAQPGDLIVLLGKGHEDYQEIKGEKIHYTELESVLSYPGL